MYMQQKVRFGLSKHAVMRLGIAFVVVCAALFAALVFLHRTKAAPSYSEISLPSQSPWGVAFDHSGNVYVAIPACDPTPVCSPNTAGQYPVGAIAKVNASTFSVVQTFTPPAGYSSPVFLAVDSSGNVWFTEPSTNALGKLNPANGSFQQWTAPSSGAPFDLTIDGQGNIWFTEVLGNKIGMFNPTNLQFSETPTPTANSKPYGIVGPDPTSGAIWFTENNAAVARVGSFKPPVSGTLSTSSINEYIIPQQGTSTTPHLLDYDYSGNIWVTGGFDGSFYRLAIAQLVSGSSSGVTRILVPCPGGAVGACGEHISGIGIDGAGAIWVDDSINNQIVSYNKGTFTQIPLATNSHPHDGLGVDSSNSVFFTEEFANKLGKIAQSGLPTPPSPTPITTVTPLPTPPPGAQSAPVNKTWYFAEGRVGKGFREYLTLDNPSSTACNVNIRYLYGLDGSSATYTKTVAVTVPATSRLTEAVHGDLQIDWNQQPAASLATVVSVTNACNGIVAERPMYFVNYHGISSGTDVLGVTHLNSTFYFGDVPTGAGSTTYLSLLNPTAGSVTVTASYYLGGNKVGTQTVVVPANARGTIAPNGIGLPAHVSAVINANAPIMVERPSYFSNVNGVYGAADVVGAQSLGNDWLFAEGYTHSVQENLSIANLDPAHTAATVTVTLKSQTGATHSYPVTVGANDQIIWNVDANNSFAGSTPEVSVEVKSTGANVVVQRQMYFHYSHNLNGQIVTTSGVTDVIGQVGPATAAIYSFAEGYSNIGYNEWLTLQNPTASAENISIVMVNGKGVVYTYTVTVPANSRSTVDITNIVRNHLAQPGDDHRGYEVAMTVMTTNNAPFVAERPLYWNTSGSSFATQGGTDIIGYIGG